MKYYMHPKSDNEILIQIPLLILLKGETFRELICFFQFRLLIDD